MRVSKNKNIHLHKVIPISRFDYCLVSGLSRKEISKKFPKREDGAYYLDKFKRHVEQDCHLSFKQYVKEHLKEEWPKCPINGEEVGFLLNGTGVVFSRFVATPNKEFCPAFKEACEKMSKERMGAGNPMFGKPAWNKDIPDDHPWKIEFIKRVTGHVKSPETVQKLRDARARHPMKARHTQKHSEESKQKCREGTAKGWANGRFNRKTSIEVKVEDFLNSLKPLLKEEFVFQHLAKYFTLDFAFPNVKVGIEAQGTFFHIDPRVYPDGPICALQRRNAGRDKSKRKYLTERGWTIIELWEIEINDGRFKEQLLCELQKLGLIKNLEQEQQLTLK